MTRTAEELVLTGEVDAVPRARQFARAVLADVSPETRDDAELVVTELVTNSLLHGRGPIAVRIFPGSEGTRIEVEDGGRDLPVRVRESVEAMTGRGLSLVVALASRWGVDAVQGGGKVVWAELLTSRGGVEGLAAFSDVDPEALLAGWGASEADESTFAVELGDVPTELLLEAKGQIDDLVREFTLAASGATSSGADQLAPGLARLIQTVVHDFAGAREQIKRQALDAAANDESMTHLRLVLRSTDADAGQRYLAALDEADRWAHTARLLTLETPPVHRVFRRWYVESVVEQLRAREHDVPPPRIATFPERLAEEFTKVAPLQSLSHRLALLQKVTAELTGAATVEDIAKTVVTNAIGSLGAYVALLYLLDDDGVLYTVAREAASGNQVPPFAERFRASDNLPGGEALRTGKLVFIRNAADLAARFPAMAGAYTDDRTLLVAPLIVGDHKLGVLGLTFHGASDIDEQTQLSLATTLADVTAQALERAVVSSAATQAAEKLSFLAEASVVLSSDLDHRSVLKAVAGLVVPRLADWCVVQLLDGDVLRNVAVAHADLGNSAWAKAMENHYPTGMHARNGAPNVIRTGVSELYPEVPKALLVAASVDGEHHDMGSELGMSSLLVVPLTGRTATFGAITMIHAESGRRYGDADVRFAEDLARRAAVAVETARAFTEQSGRLDVVSRIAEATQRAILAPPPASVGPVALAARYVSATADALVGGDLYEVVARPGAVRLIIGDVRGKGLGAVRTATIVIGEFRAAAADVDSLVDVARQIDRRLRPYLGDEDFVTALLAEITDDGDYTIACCGHPPALLRTWDTVTALETSPSLPLGLGAEPVLRTGTLRPGEQLLLYTDGLIEARDAQRDFVDLFSLIAPRSAADLDDALEDIVMALRRSVGGALGDDLALLVAEYRPPSM